MQSCGDILADYQTHIPSEMYMVVETLDDAISLLIDPDHRDGGVCAMPERMLT